MATDFIKARENMVDGQIHPSGIVSMDILEAFQAVPREKFVPQEVREMAYSDEDLPIGDGRFLLEPSIHARMIQAAAPQPGDVVLDIGSGTGYSAAVLSSMVTTIVALEENRDYLDQAAKLWQELDAHNIIGVEGRMIEGNPENAPFSLIFINGAVSTIPANIVAQLTPEGRLITILKQPGARMGQAVIARNLGEGQYSSYNLFDAGSPYLSGFAPKPAFNF